MILPPPAATNFGIGRVRAGERAGQVGVEHVAPLGDREFLRRLANIHAGIVDEDVQAAELGYGILNEFRARRIVGDVHHEGGHLHPVLADLGRGCCVLLRIAPRHSDRRARLSEPQRHAKADAAVAAGDERDTAFEIEGGHGAGSGV